MSGSSGRAPGERERVSVAIVAWNAERDIAATLDHIRQQTRRADEVVVIENASTDRTAEIARAVPGVRLISPGKNLGYAGGANEAYRWTAGDWLLMVNQDAFLAPDYLERALNAAARAGGTGVRVGAVQGLVLRTTSDECSTPASRTIDALGIELRRTRRNLILGHGRPEATARAGEVFGPDGAVALFHRAALEEVAAGSTAGTPFDAGFFFSREEVDWAWRAQRLGWRTIVEPAARAFHCRTLTAASARTVPLAIRRASARNRYLLLIRNERALDLLRDLPWVVGWEILYLGYMLLRDPRALLGGLADAIRLFPRAWRDRRKFFAMRPKHLDAPRRFLGVSEPLAVRAKA